MKLESNEVSNSLMKTFFTGLDSIQRCSVPLTGYPKEAEELFVATERNAKLRYEGYKKLSEMLSHLHTKTTKAEASDGLGFQHFDFGKEQIIL